MSLLYNISYFPIGIFIDAENSDNGEYDIVYRYYTKYVMSRPREVADIRVMNNQT